MAVRIEFHPPARKRRTRRDGPSPLVVLGIATVVVGTHLVFWLVGLIE